MARNKQKPQPEAAPETETAKTEAESTPETEEQPKVSKSVVPKKFRDRYKANKGRCGDEMSGLVSDFLFPDGETFSQERFEQLCRDNGVEKRWEGKNTGMKRMNLGNVLRGKLNNGTDVKIGNKTVKGKAKAA